MIELYGFPVSNYYNKVKLVLLEKEIPFVERMVDLSRHKPDLTASPFGKIPYLQTPDGPLCESQVIADYLERAYPSHPLLPPDPHAAAKQRELTACLELNLELVARELYGEAYFGRGPTPSAIRDTAQERLRRYLTAFKSLTRFTPCVGGDSFGLADCAAYVHLPVIGTATRKVYGTDLLLEAGIDWKSYVKALADRPSVRRVNEDTKTYLAAQAR